MLLFQCAPPKNNICSDEITNLGFIEMSKTSQALLQPHSCNDVLIMTVSDYYDMQSHYYENVSHYYDLQNHIFTTVEMVKNTLLQKSHNEKLSK